MLNRLLLFPLIYAVVRLFGLTYRFRSQFPAVAADAAALAELPDPLHIEYVRLNILARRPS